MTNVQGPWSNLSFLNRKHQASHVSCKTQTSHHGNPADIIGRYTRNEDRLRDVKALFKAMPKHLLLLCFKLVKEGTNINFLM